ncbi:MAG: type IVB secretion system protein IcmG/DotF [Tatlockia sp.]|jgi:intracellular multiplication protein IcmG
MADDQFDEYQFSDLDTMDADSLEHEEKGLETETPYAMEPEKKNVMRNALIVIILIVIALLGYKMVSNYFAKKSETTGIPVSIPSLTPVAGQPGTVTTVPQEQTSVVPASPPAPAPVPAPAQQAPDYTQMSQKLSSLEIGQQNVRTEVNSVGNQLAGINSNVTQLTEKIASLNQLIASLEAKLDRQSNDIAMAAVRAKPKPVRHVVVKTRHVRTVYHIQAVIPGRAWLIAANGSTITVREGTQLAGYGVITLIDPNQGRVVTSSGQVIRFSQQDS